MSGTSMSGEDGLDPPDAEVRYETKYLDIAPLFEAPLCGGTLTMLDSHCEYVVNALGLKTVERVPVYIRHGDNPAPDGWCVGSVGCYRNGIVVTELSSAPHELVHALTIGARGSSYWNEPVAEAFESNGYPSYQELWIKAPQWLDIKYNGLRRNGHLVRWLIDWSGGAALMDLFDATEPGASQIEVEAAFRQVYGMELNVALSEYAATAPYVYPDHLQCYVPEGTVEVPWDGDWWEHELYLDCTKTSTFTAGDEISRMSARVPFSIAQAGKYRFAADHPDAEIVIHLCIDEPLNEPFEELSQWPSTANPILGVPIFPIGRYVLEVSVPLGDPISVRVQGYPSIEPETVP